jgi:hypothetical protein
MRNLLKKNYILLRNILEVTHHLVDELILLTNNYKISNKAHQLLEKIIKRNWQIAINFENTFQMVSSTVL